MNRTILSIVLLFSAVSLLRAQPQEGPLTLEAAIAEALDANFSIKIARNDTEITRNNVTYAPFLPNLALSGRQTQTINDSRVTYREEQERRDQKNTVDNFNAGVNLVWRLFDGMNMFATYDRQRELFKQGELSLRAAIETLIAEVSNQFYSLLIREQQLEAARYYLEISQMRYNQAREKYSIGAISGLEMKQAKIDFNADSSELIVQELQLTNAYVEFGRMLNRQPDTTLRVEGSIVPEPVFSFDDLKEKTLAGNTDIRMAQSDGTVARQDLRLARSLRYPTLDFSTGYAYSYSQNPISVAKYNSTTGYNWGFSLSFNIFDGLETNRKVRNAKIGIRNSDLNLRQTEQTVVSDLMQTYNSYRNNLKMIDFEQESAEAARLNLEAAVDMYRLGTMSGIEFREIQRSYMAAEVRRLSALYQTKISEISLMFLSGELVQ